MTGTKAWQLDEVSFLIQAGMRANYSHNHYKDVDGVFPIPAHIRMVGRYSAPLWEARLYGWDNLHYPVWTSPKFEDPISAFVYAQTENWGQ